MTDRRLMPLEGVPPPGELLQPSIAPENQAAMKRELAERAALIAGKIQGRWAWLAVLRMRWQARRLERRLARMGYDGLVARRLEVWRRYKSAQALGLDVSGLAAQGRALNGALARLAPMRSKLTDIQQRLSAHAKALAWEREDKANRRAFRREVITWTEQIQAVFKQNARLHHIHQLPNGKTRMDVPKIQRVYVKEDKVLFHVKTSYQGVFQRLTDRWANALPYNVDVSDLVSEVTLQNLSAACRRPVTVEWSKRGYNLFYVISRLDSSDGIPNRVLYSKAVEFYPVERHAKTPWAAGMTANRKIHWFDFEDTPHVLIAGSTKSGKSNHVNQMIASLVTMNSPAELRLMLIDLKGGIEFTHWSGLRHELRPMVKRAEDVVEALRWLRGVMERRLAMFEQIKAKNLESYNKKAATRIPRLICLVDEMATLIGLGELTTEIHTELRVLSSQGRAVGINLVLCTQHSSVDVLPGWVKTNMGLRISGKMPSVSASQVVLDSVTAANLPNIPGRLVFSVGRFEVIAQSPYISDDEVARAVAISQAYPAPDNAEFLDSATQAPLEVKPKFGRDEALKVIMEQMDGQLSALKLFELMKGEISNRQARALIDEIVVAAQQGIDWSGDRYEIVKRRNSPYLTRQSTGQESRAVGD